MSDTMLTRLGATSGDLIIEGSFANNPAFAALLAALRPSQPVFTGSDAAGTARGAALLAKWPPLNVRPASLVAVPACAVEGLYPYREAWTRAVLER
jgi:L-fuculokinase